MDETNESLRRVIGLLLTTIEMKRMEMGLKEDEVPIYKLPERPDHFELRKERAKLEAKRMKKREEKMKKRRSERLTAEEELLENMTLLEDQAGPSGELEESQKKRKDWKGKGRAD